MSTEAYLQFFTASEIPSKHLVGYRLQIQACAAISHLVAKRKERFSILLFGVPGTGKNLFPYALAGHVRQSYGVHFSLAHVECDRLVSIQDVPKAIDKIKRIMTLSEEHSPTFVVFDQIDALSAPITNASRKSAELTRFMRGLIEDQPTQTLIIGVSNYPSNIEFSVMRRIRASIYLEPTPIYVAEKIIRNLLNRRDSEKVAQELSRKLEADSLKALSVDLVEACQLVLKLYAAESQHLPAERLAEALFAFTPGVPGSYVEKYEKDHLDLIRHSKVQQEYWKKIYAETVPGN